MNQKTRLTKTCKSPYRQAVWESVMASTLCKELNSSPIKSTSVLSRTQLPIFCSDIQETPETHRLQFCWALDSLWPSIQTILASSDLKMQLQITSWLPCPTSGDSGIWNSWLCMHSIMRFARSAKNFCCKRFLKKNGWTGSRISSRLKFNDPVRFNAFDFEWIWVFDFEWIWVFDFEWIWVFDFEWIWVFDFEWIWVFYFEWFWT